MKILLPISIDRWTNPISALLRACVEYNPTIEFHSFSNPLTDEDNQQGKIFWGLANLVKTKPSTLLGQSYDIVHTASYSHGNIVASVLAKLRGLGRTRFLNTMNLEPDPDNPVAWARYQRLLRAADGFVAVSEAVARDFRDRAPSRLLGVIPNGFDPTFYNPANTKAAHLPEKIKQLGRGFPLWVAGLEKRKHPEVFIALAKRNPNIQFVAIGGVIPNDGEIFVEEFKKTPNIHWMGTVERHVARTILAFAGVLVFPSEREGLSLAMIEALGMGIPIIAQPKSSMPELVSEGINGSLLDISDTDGWNRELLRYVFLSDTERAEIFSRVRDRAVEQFQWSRVGGSYGAIYPEMMKRQRSLFHSCPKVVSENTKSKV